MNALPLPPLHGVVGSSGSEDEALTIALLLLAVVLVVIGFIANSKIGRHRNKRDK